ncbi:Hypothetical predicted protein, partial [Pelobates cultripes]
GQQQTLQAPIIVQEIHSIIAALPTGKLPGLDGLSNQYYKTYSRTLGPHLQNSFQAMLPAGAALSEMLMAHIATLPKPGKLPNRAQNLRPISLLNTDILADIMLTIVYDDQ